MLIGKYSPANVSSTEEESVAFHAYRVYLLKILAFGKFVAANCRV